MSRVLIFGMTKNFGGVEAVIMNYHRNINRKKIQFDFICNGTEMAYSDEINQLGGNIYYMTPISKNFLKYKKEIENFFKDNAYKYNAIWINVCALVNIDCLIYARKYGIKTRIIHSHNSQSIASRFKTLLHNINKKRIYKYANVFWACSEEAGKFFFNNNKFEIINNAIDLDKFKFNEEKRIELRKKYNIDNKLVVGNVARFHFQKNHPFLIDVFYQLYQKEKDTMLVLIGDGEDLLKIKQKVKELCIEDNVLFLGSRKDTNDLYNMMDIFVLPSLFEGLPVVLLEAQSNGLPIIAASDGIPENAKIVENFKFLSLKDSSDEWANNIININKKNCSIENVLKLKNNGYDIKNECKKLESIFVDK